MKRGLVVLKPEEVGPEEFSLRVARLPSTLGHLGVECALIYGDVYRSGDITYLSNLCIYWNEGLLAVPATGPVTFFTKLSPRVHPWMRRTSVVEDLRSGPNLAELVRTYLADRPAGAIGLVEAGWWPKVLADEMRAKLSDRPLKDLGPVVRRFREQPSGAELALLARGAAVSGEAVALGLDPGLTNAERAGRAKMRARMAGVEDVYVFARPLGEQGDTLEVITEYRGYWTAAGRTIWRERPAWAGLLETAYRETEARLGAGTSLPTLQQAAGSVPGLSIDLLHHTEVETGGDYRLPEEATRPLAAGAVVTLVVRRRLEDQGEAVLADTYAIEAGGARRLTATLPPV